MRALRPVLAAVVVAVSGCGASPVTAGALQGSLAGAFARLYVLQQTEQGLRAPDLAALQASGGCQKGAAATTQRGPGNDWVCAVTFFVDGPGTPVRALYNVDVHPDGCWSADGDGPTAVNGGRTVLDPAGRAHPNPLYLIDGCFDVG